MKLDLPMMVVYLLVAAGLQTLVPSIPFEPVSLKIPFLPCVALYYILERPWPMALTAVLWAGVFTDALGMLPHGTTTAPLFLLAIAILMVRRLQPEGSLFPAMILAPVMIFVLLIIQAIVARGAFEIPPPFLPLFKTISLNAAISALVAPVFVSVARKLDLVAGNVEPRKDIGS